jgi:uncharacterized protein
VAKAKPAAIPETHLMVVRNSPVHGLGVFATEGIKKGTRIIEYIGERVTHAEADRRYEDKEENDNHTFLFSVDSKVVIDAGVEGNDARYFNHSCDPNCESVIEDRRVFIEAVRDIAGGDELTYDYQIGRERDDPPNIDEIYACKCGAKDCRGTMLWPAKRPGRAKARKKAALAKGKAKSGVQGKSAVRAKKKAGASSKSGVGAKSSAHAKSKARAKGKAVRKGSAPGKSAAGKTGSASARGKRGAVSKTASAARGKSKAPAKSKAKSRGKTGRS